MFAKVKKNCLGQSISEYVVLVGIVSMALLGMQVYMKRGIQGVIKDVADQVGCQREGGVERDANMVWKLKEGMKMTESVSADSRIVAIDGGGVFYDKHRDVDRWGRVLRAVGYEKSKEK